ncbi:MAG: hypothetical protein NZ874_05105 [Fimbriimonadales bacterium]|nr:hypothetical protein [Fimbriimonadales bacterium]
MKARGYTHDDIIALYKVVDYFMVLPQEYEQLVQRVIHEVESEREFPLTSLEKLAIMQGLEQGLGQGWQQAILDLLALRFGNVPEALQARLRQTLDNQSLRRLLRLAYELPSLEAFEQALQEMVLHTDGQPNSEAE